MSSPVDKTVEEDAEKEQTPAAPENSAAEESSTFKEPTLPARSLAQPSEPIKKFVEPKPLRQRVSGAEQFVPVPYEEPNWAQVPEQSYSLDVLKNGVLMESISLSVHRSFITVGRLAQCEVQLEHPSISRFHAVLQFGNDGMERTVADNGWYLYDLGSTHGSWRNKHQVPARQYVRLHVGHVLKFGGSTRLLILQGPPEDEEPESKRTVTEIRKEAERRKLIMEGVIDADPEKDADLMKKDDDEDNDNEIKTKDQSEGISWGIDTEYAVGDDDDGEGEQIDFEALQEREDYYRDDPKRILKNFFDREGIELKYEYDEKGANFKHQWNCRIELPVETPSGKSLYAEVTISGNKRVAQVQCALEACRILDLHGVLRKSRSESKRVKLRDLADNDFYDSDEDTFLDRTGELEHKRLKRKRRIEGETDGQKAETYDQLCQQLQAAEAELLSCQSQLDKLSDQANLKVRPRSQDSLDQFMESVRRSAEDMTESQETKIQKSQLRLKLVQLKNNAERLTKLVKIAKPVDLPALKKPTPLPTESQAAAKQKMVWVGSMKGHRLRKVVQEPEQPPSIVQPGLKENEVVEEEEEPELPVTNESEHSSPKEKEEPSENDNEKSAEPETMPPIDKTDKIYTVEAAPKDYSETADYDNESEAQKSRVRVRNRVRKVKEKETDAEYDASDPDYAVWLPPDNQSGDGKTNLNAKFGY